MPWGRAIRCRREFRVTYIDNCLKNCRNMLEIMLDCDIIQMVDKNIYLIIKKILSP